MPELLVLTDAPAAKPVPVRVTGTFVPAAPLAGLIDVSVGAGGLTVNATAAVVPLDVVTVTLEAPKVAPALIAKFAVICVALTTTTLLTVIPGLVVLTVAPEMKLVPVSVMPTLLPAGPAAGLIEVNVGTGGFTVNVTGVVVAPDTVTVMLEAPKVAPAPIAKLAVIWVALTTTTLLTVIPALFVFTVAPETKFVPVNVTGTVVPVVPLAGLTELRVAAGGFSVNVTGVLVPPDVVTVTLETPKLGPALIAKHALT